MLQLCVCSEYNVKCISGHELCLKEFERPCSQLSRPQLDGSSWGKAHIHIAFL